jgi:Glycosyltransferases involved in cell wall biogenesis
VNYKISILIPTYNERENIELLLKILTSRFNFYEILIVDDGSTDGTIDIIEKFTRKYPNVKLIERGSKKGLGSALKEGILSSKADYIITIDADLSHNPYEIPKLISKLNTNQIVIGSRHLKGSKIIGWNFYRFLIHITANLIAKWFLMLKCSDITSGFRVYKRDSILKIIKYAKSSGFSFQVEVLYIAKKLNYKITEVPIIFINRKKGKSKFNVIEMLEYLKTILSLIKRTREIK